MVGTGNHGYKLIHLHAFDIEATAIAFWFSIN